MPIFVNYLLEDVKLNTMPTWGYEMTITFKELPKSTQRRLIERLGLPKDEQRVMTLRYVEELSYSRIAAEMHMSVSSVGSFLTRTRQHVIKIARECYDLADDDTKKIIDLLGWREIEWPITQNRNKLKRKGE